MVKTFAYTSNREQFLYRKWSFIWSLCMKTEKKEQNTLNIKFRKSKKSYCHNYPITQEKNISKHKL